jgi:hypothetical protein
MSIFCQYCSFDLRRYNVFLGSSNACSVELPFKSFQVFGVHIQWKRDTLLSMTLNLKEQMNERICYGNRS